MSDPPRPSYGRAATLLALGVLLLTVCAAAYLYFAQSGRTPDRFQTGPVEQRLETGAPDDVDRLVMQTRRQVTMLTLLLVSALLILLFAVGAYLVIRIGRFVARGRVGGRPTVYVDAWSSYRLTAAQIAAATGEDSGGKGGSDPPQAGPPPDAPSGSNGP